MSSLVKRERKPLKILKIVEFSVFLQILRKNERKHFLWDVVQDKLKVLVFKKKIVVTPCARMSVKPIIFCGLVWSE